MNTSFNIKSCSREDLRHYIVLTTSPSYHAINSFRPVKIDQRSLRSLDSTSKYNNSLVEQQSLSFRSNNIGNFEQQSITSNSSIGKNTRLREN